MLAAKAIMQSKSHSNIKPTPTPNPRKQLLQPYHSTTPPAMHTAPIHPHILRTVALVVGNSNYAAISNLGNDAEDITRALQGFGFSVTTLKDAARRNINTAMETFGSAAVKFAPPS